MIMVSKDVYMLLILHILVNHRRYNNIEVIFHPIIARVLQLIITN